MSQILKATIVISFVLTFLDIMLSLSTGRAPFIWRLTYDIILIIIAGIASIILLLLNIVFGRWDQIFPDLGLFFQALFVFITRFPENFVDFFISFLQFPFWLFASLLELIGLDSYVKIEIPFLHAYFSIDLATIEIIFFVEILGQYVWVVINFFGNPIVQEVSIDQFGFAVIHYLQIVDQPIQNNLVISLKELFIDPIVNAFKFGMEEWDLEDIVNQIVEQF